MSQKSPMSTTQNHIPVANTQAELDQQVLLLRVLQHVDQDMKTYLEQQSADQNLSQALSDLS